jgi:hypothetical protein
VEHSSVSADHVPLDLTGNYEDRRRSCICRSDGGGRILQTRARHNQGCANAASSSGVTISHIGRGLLMSRGDELDVRLVTQGVKGVIELHTGQSKYYSNALSLKLFGQGLSTGHLWHYS